MEGRRRSKSRGVRTVCQYTVFGVLIPVEEGYSGSAFGLLVNGIGFIDSNEVEENGIDAENNAIGTIFGDKGVIGGYCEGGRRNIGFEELRITICETGDGTMEDGVRRKRERSELGTVFGDEDEKVEFVGA